VDLKVGDGGGRARGDDDGGECRIALFAQVFRQEQMRTRGTWIHDLIEGVWVVVKERVCC